jgi:hypothetical protein
MRTVFNSNQDLANTFAAQNQVLGRTKSMFFEHETAFSYGYHYIAAKFITADNGQKVCFVNSRHYSVTTAKHVQNLFKAVYYNKAETKVFRVPIPRNFGYWQIGEVLKQMKEEAETYFKKQLSARTSDFNYTIGMRIAGDIKEISELFSLCVPSLWDFEYQKEAWQKVSLIYNKEVN